MKLKLTFPTNSAGSDDVPVTIVIGSAYRSSPEEDYSLNVTINDMDHKLWCVNPLNGLELALAFINAYLEAKGFSQHEVIWSNSDG